MSTLTNQATSSTAGTAGPTPVKKTVVADPANEAVTIQLPKHIHDWFKARAEADERTVAKFLARLLRDHHASATTTVSQAEQRHIAEQD